jgi:GNAT superfamily N-acetyltransferase
MRQHVNDESTLRRTTRPPEGAPVAIVPYIPAHRDAFERLNRAWLAELWVEPRDEQVFADPEAAYAPGGGAVFSALRDGRVVGTVALRRESDATWELCKLAVDERERGRGIGAALVHAVIDAARARGARTLFLTTNTRLAAAVRLYERMGFEVRAARAHPERTRANLEMTLTLAGAEGTP